MLCGGFRPWLPQKFKNKKKKTSTTFVVEFFFVFFVVLEGTSALAAECLGAKCQANDRAGKEMKSKLCCKCRHQTESNVIYHSDIVCHKRSEGCGSALMPLASTTQLVGVMKGRLMAVYGSYLQRGLADQAQ